MRQAADASGAKVALIDRDMDETLRRPLLVVYICKCLIVVLQVVVVVVEVVYFYRVR
jgi:hypothetical protein